MASAEAESGYTQVAGAEFEAPLLPQPRPGTLLGTFFWRTELLRQSVSSGVRLSAAVFVHRDVWRQEGARVVGMPAKVTALTATIKSLQDLHKWIAPSMETLQQLVQQPGRLTRAASQFRLSAAQVERRLRTQFSVLAADGSAAEPADSAAAAPTSSAPGTIGGGGAGSGTGAGAGAGAGTGAGASTSARTGNAPSGKPAPPPVPPRSTVKPAAGHALKGIASKRSSFSVSVSRFGGALFNMVSKGAATAMEKLSQTMTVRVKAEELTNYSQMINVLCTELGVLHGWVRAGYGVTETELRQDGATKPEAAKLVRRASFDGGAGRFGVVTYPASMGEAERATWANVVRSICREDAGARAAVEAACVALNATLVELLLRDLEVLAALWVHRAAAKLMETRMDTSTAEAEEGILDSGLGAMVPGML